jgi:aspartyl/asparaginyl beta-hydroxylase (cupin superfamily)
MFSLLAPRTRIPPHTGVANTRLVCHLALIVPPDCGFRVGNTTVEWKEGEAFVFDDTIEHEAWNDSDQLRVVLIADLWPPALNEAGRRAVASVIPAAGVGFGGGM